MSKGAAATETDETGVVSKAAFFHTEAKARRADADIIARENKYHSLGDVSRPQPSDACKGSREGHRVRVRVRARVRFPFSLRRHRPRFSFPFPLSQFVGFHCIPVTFVCLFL